jgi:hypothetical protein
VWLAYSSRAEPIAVGDNMMTTKELTEAVNLLMEREQSRIEDERQSKALQARRRREDMESSIGKLTESVVVIKWCIVSMTAVMFITVLAVVLIVMEVEREAERIKVQVQAIQREAELIRDKIRHPLESIGGAVGRGLDGKIKEAIGGE